MIHVLDRLAVGNYEASFTNKFNYVLSLLSDPEVTELVRKGNSGKFGRDICYVDAFIKAIKNYYKLDMLEDRFRD